MRHTTGRARAARFATTILLAVGIVLPMVAEAPSAFAQDDAPATAPKKPKKKKPKPKPAATEAPADAAPAEPPPPPPPAETAPPPPPPAPTPPPAEQAAPAEAPITDVYEKPAKNYTFIGLRYRGTVVPKFMMNLFVNEGATIYSNTIGAEIDLRRDDFSLIPWIVYTSYQTGDMLFMQKGQPDLPQNYSDVNSQLQAIYVGADVLWSKHISNNFQFEYGAGFGLGVLFGSLTNDWVYQTPNGPLVGSNGNHYTACQTVNDDTSSNQSCEPSSHQNSTVNKVGGYQEKNWLNGGSVPVVFPHLALPELGIRYKPIKEVEARLVIGFSLTGFFFGLSADYGLESRKDDKPPPPPADEKH